jgi:hypothetical protein
MNSYEFFLHENLSKYEGEWVAIVDNKVVSHSTSAKDAYEEAKEKFPSKEPLMTKASGKEILVV